MTERISGINEVTGEVEVERETTIESILAAGRFVFERGYRLEAIDLGLYAGIKMEMSHGQYGTATILLDPETVEKLAYWLLKSMGQKIPTLPSKLPIAIKAVLENKAKGKKLKSGNRKIFEDTMEVLRDVLYHEESKEI